MTASLNDPKNHRLTEAQLRMILTALAERRVEAACVRCGNQNFGIEPMVHMMAMQATMGGQVLGGPSIPAIVTYCQRCGWLAQHAMGALGLIGNIEFDRAGLDDSV